MYIREQGDRYEFTNAVIGWLGYDLLYLDILNCSEEEFNCLINNESEKFEDLLAENLSKFSINELNELSYKHNLGYKIYEI